MKILVATLLALAPAAAFAEVTEYQRGGMAEEKCYRYEYREEYVPGSSSNPGYVKSYRDKIEVPCQGSIGYRPAKPVNPSRGRVDDNSCIEGTVIGGILGGGLAGAISEPDSMIWSIPLGIVGGAMTGCQIDGG